MLVSCVARQSVGLILKLGIFGIRITESKNTLLCVQLKFGNLGFSIGKSENSGFFRNY